MFAVNNQKKYAVRVDGKWVDALFGQLEEGDVVRITDPQLQDGSPRYFRVTEQPRALLDALTQEAAEAATEAL